MRSEFYLVLLIAAFVMALLAFGNAIGWWSL